MKKMIKILSIIFIIVLLCGCNKKNKNSTLDDILQNINQYELGETNNLDFSLTYTLCGKYNKIDEANWSQEFIRVYFDKDGNTISIEHTIDENKNNNFELRNIETNINDLNDNYEKLKKYYEANNFNCNLLPNDKMFKDTK